ncbi:MAG: hypothetical protein LBV17_01340 [Treponema sp.]|jgi:hypothetical protein|nr:hypothetical protein [Treponema sp.]
MSKKTKERTIYSSVVEYLTYITATRNNKKSIEMRYEDKYIWLIQQTMAVLYDVSVVAINQHIKNIFDDYKFEPKATIKRYLIDQNEGNRQVSCQIDHYNLQIIIAVGVIKENFSENQLESAHTKEVKNVRRY